MVKKLLRNNPFLQMANVDREMAALGEERAEKSKRLNLKRMQHVSTLQQLSEFFLWKWSTTHIVWNFYGKS